MRALLICFVFFSSQYLFAEEKQVCCKLKKQEPKPKVIYKTQWKTKVVEKKVPVKEKCCEKRPSNTIHKSRTGNQKVIIKMPKQRDRIIIKYRTKVKRKRVRVEVHTTNPNRLQILVGKSKTKQEIEQKGCCDLNAKRKYELDIGVQYLRDFGGFTGSLTGTVNESYYIGAGFNW